MPTAGKGYHGCDPPHPSPGSPYSKEKDMPKKDLTTTPDPKGSVADLIAKIEAFMAAHPALANLLAGALSLLLGLLTPGPQPPALKGCPAPDSSMGDCCEASVQAALCSLACALRCAECCAADGPAVA